MIEWIDSQGNFDHLYKQWRDSGYLKDTKPSIDRIDNTNGYSFDNMRLTTWLENRKAQYDDVLAGHPSVGIRLRPVMSVSEDGHIVEYHSMAFASRTIGYRIDSLVGTGKKCKNGLVWKDLK